MTSTKTSPCALSMHLTLDADLPTDSLSSLSPSLKYPEEPQSYKMVLSVYCRVLAYHFWGFQVNYLDFFGRLYFIYMKEVICVKYPEIVCFQYLGVPVLLLREWDPFYQTHRDLSNNIKKWFVALINSAVSCVKMEMRVESGIVMHNLWSCWFSQLGVLL